VARATTAVEESAWRLRKARSLVKLLALAPERTIHRDQALQALWPDLEPDAASNNLRQALFVARRALDSCGDAGAARLELAQDTLILSDDCLRVDVDEFEAAADTADEDPSVAALCAAVELYGGELLPEDRYEEWAIARREALKERQLRLLLALAERHLEQEDDGAAVATLQQAVLVEPLHERAHRELMRIYAVTGRRQRALGQFHLLREALRREFEDEPDDETRRLYQDILARRIGGEAIADRAPQPRRSGSGQRSDSRQRSPGNLPLQLTSFIGRDRELREVTGLAGRHRLLTLTGPGGCGKTRLALEAATLLLPKFADGAWLVELAGLSDGALVAHAVAASLGVESRSSRPSQDAIAAHIADRAMLLVLDNCEHLVSASARLVEALLVACPQLRILATSREPLHAAGEVDWRVPSLSPAAAVKLFAERAASVSSRFVASQENADAVSDICCRLDGMPLAIELAAARVGVLAPAQIAERLQHSLSLLAATRRTALTRQQTLTATIDWSHDLLDDPERKLFRRLGAFAGTFDLAAVEFVCDGELDVLAALVDKSLVTVEEHGGVARYLLLDTVRHYAREKLVAAGERAELEERHRRHYVTLAEALEPELADPTVRQRLALEADEMRWALRSALRSDPATAIRLAVALWRYWHDRGDLTEGSRWLDEALEAAPQATPARAAALHGRSVLALRTSDHERALSNAVEAVGLYREFADPRALSEELHHLGTLSWVFTNFDGAVDWCQQSHRAANEAGLRGVMASVLHTLGVIATSRRSRLEGRRLIEQSIELLGELGAEPEPLLLPVSHGYGLVPGSRHRRFLEHTFVTAHRTSPVGAIAYVRCDLAAVLRESDCAAAGRVELEHALATFRSLGDDLGAAQALAQLGNHLSADGEHDLARELHDESMSLRQAANEARGIGLSSLAIAQAAMNAGEFDRARAAAERALALFTRTDDGPGCAAATMQLGYIVADSGPPRDALRLLEQALVLWQQFIHHVGWAGDILIELALLERASGETRRATGRLEQALAVFEHFDDRVGIALCREALEEPTNVVLTAD
jgi:predicted ATPase